MAYQDLFKSYLKFELRDFFGDSWLRPAHFITKRSEGLLISGWKNELTDDDNLRIDKLLSEKEGDYKMDPHQFLMVKDFTMKKLQKTMIDSESLALLVCSASPLVKNVHF